MNDDHTLLKIPQACGASWLFMCTGVNRIISKWAGGPRRNGYAAMVLSQIFNDTSNKYYLLFLDWILAGAQRVNKTYQAPKQDPTKLFEDLVGLVKSMASEISLPTSRYDVFSVKIEEHLDSTLYLGHRFETAVRAAGLSQSAEKKPRLRPRSFIVELFK